MICHNNKAIPKLEPKWLETIWIQMIMMVCMINYDYDYDYDHSATRLPQRGSSASYWLLATPSALPGDSQETCAVLFPMHPSF